MKCMQCVSNGKNGGRVCIYIMQSTRANRNGIILKDLKSSPLKLRSVVQKPFLVYLEQITSIFSVTFCVLLYSKGIKNFELYLFNMDHFKVMLHKTICNDDF